MHVLNLIASLAVSMFVFEILTWLQRPKIRRTALDRLVLEGHASEERRRSTFDSLVVAIFPERFDPETAKTVADVTTMLKRAGYPYNTPGDFYASAIRDFGLYLTVGGGAAAMMAVFDMALVGPVLALIFIFLGLRRPYSRLKALARKRAEGMKTNMLIGMSVMETLVLSGVSPVEAAKNLAKIGGPFCNLMGLLVAQQARTDIRTAIEVVREHLPDPREMEPILFLRDLESAYSDENGRPIGQSLAALRLALHRNVIEATEARVSLVRQRSSLFGVLSVLGLILAIILPYLGVAF